MKTIKVELNSKQIHYNLYVGSRILSDLKNIVDLSKYTKIAVITDENLEDKLEVFEDLERDITEIIITPGENEKNINTVQFIWKELLESGFDRKSLVINYGGGVIGDMGGFAASTFMRGIDFIQIPTTLLSQVDASIGGKTGINFGNVKNIIGAFNQPIAVIIDTDTLKTLPKREFYSGFAEIIKHGFIYDMAFLKKLDGLDPNNISDEDIQEIIEYSCKIKSEVVTKDEKESGLRKILNFGHTIGHAVESLMLESDNPLLHGEAISIGMVAEAKISYDLGNIKKEELEMIVNILAKYNLPTKLKNIDEKYIKLKLLSDKKNEGGNVKWTLLKELGKSVFDVEVEDNIVDEAVRYVMD